MYSARDRWLSSGEDLSWHAPFCFPVQYIAPIHLEQSLFTSLFYTFLLM
jgi:hypothetical protein